MTPEAKAAAEKWAKNNKAHLTAANEYWFYQGYDSRNEELENERYTRGVWEDRAEKAEKEVAKLKDRLAQYPAEWQKDSSLETWFPQTAEEIAKLRERIAQLEGQPSGLPGWTKEQLEARLSAISQQPNAHPLVEALKRIANDKEFSHDANGNFVRKVWYVEEAKRALTGTGEK